MKIAIISDIHDNLANLERFLVMFGQECEALSASHENNRKVEPCGIICCGDVTTPETLEYLVERFDGLIKLVCGNMEIRREEFAEVAKRHANLEVFAEVGVWECPTSGVEQKKSRAGLDLAFVHKPDRVEELTLRRAQGKPYDFVFYGHTHKPWIKVEPDDRLLRVVQRRSSGTILANPGTLGGIFTASTFAVLETETGRLELKKLY